MLGLITPQMRRDARTFCEAGVLLMDGTFGLTREKVNIFFLITSDDNGKGIILCVLLVAPDPIARSPSASYDSKLLKELLKRWARAEACDEYGSNYLNGRKVTPVVRMTAPTPPKSVHCVMCCRLSSR